MSRKSKYKGAPPGTWSEIIIEGYCTYDLAKEGKEMEYFEFKFDSNRKIILTGETKKKNIFYKNAKIPDYCKNKISINCLGKDGKMCPFFRYSESDLDSLIEIYYGKEALDFLKGKRKE